MRLPARPCVGPWEESDSGNCAAGPVFCYYLWAAILAQQEAHANSKQGTGEIRGCFLGPFDMPRPTLLPCFVGCLSCHAQRVPDFKMLTEGRSVVQARTVCAQCHTLRPLLGHVLRGGIRGLD